MDGQIEMYYGAKPITFERAKIISKNMTEAEKVLWNKLRKNQLLGIKFRRQHPIDIYIADFYCHKAKLVIEIDGEIHNNQKEKDKSRTNEFEKLGIREIRFSNEEVQKNIDKVLAKIIDKLLSAK